MHARLTFCSPERRKTSPQNLRYLGQKVPVSFCSSELSLLCSDVRLGVSCSRLTTLQFRQTFVFGAECRNFPPATRLWASNGKYSGPRNVYCCLAPLIRRGMGEVDFEKSCSCPSFQRLSSALCPALSRECEPNSCQRSWPPQKSSLSCQYPHVILCIREETSRSSWAQ